MLGHRGCRLCITYPEILEMQVRAIIEAAVHCTVRGITVLPEIMIPLTIDANELALLVQWTHDVAESILGTGNDSLDYMVGTMVETPRAALTADRMAEVSEFFSFGTNDLTQMTMGLSRDDAGRFLPDYVDEQKAAVFDVDPFQSLDIEGVGRLVFMACEAGRDTRKNIKLGICGEHGGDPESIMFCPLGGIGLRFLQPLSCAHRATGGGPGGYRRGGRRQSGQTHKATGHDRVPRKRHLPRKVLPNPGRPRRK